MFRLLLFCAFLTLSMQSIAQPESFEFPDWTHTDINGVEHNLYTQLDDGKTVIIDIFTTWCPNCVNSLSNLHDLEEMYGENGTGQLVLYSFERDPSTSNEAAWAADHNVTNPIFVDALATMETWNTFYQPNFFVICPDRSYELVVGSIAVNNPLPGFVANCITSDIALTQSAEFSLASTIVTNNVTFSCTSSNGDYKIIGLNGATLKQGKTTSTVTLDVSDLAKGIYLLQVQTESDVVTRKFVVQ
jgi:thiol-disulfide isomerase/thioredoxin